MTPSMIVRAQSPLFPSMAYTFPKDGEYFLGRAEAQGSPGGVVIAVFDPDMHRLAELTGGHCGNLIISRQHAAIRVGPSPDIDDCASRNGLFYIPSGREDGAPTRIIEPYSLSRGDHLICFGDNEWRVPLRLHVE